MNAFSIRSGLVGSAVLAASFSTASAGEVQRFLPTSGTAMWHSDSNWLSSNEFLYPSMAPNSADHVAFFRDYTGNRTVIIDHPSWTTVGEIQFNNEFTGFSTTISPASATDAIVFGDISLPQALLTSYDSSASNNVINARLVVASPELRIYVSDPSSSIELAETLTAFSPRTISKGGPGTLILSADNMINGSLDLATIDLESGALSISDEKNLGAAVLNFTGGCLHVDTASQPALQDVDIEFPGDACFDIEGPGTFICQDNVDSAIAGPGSLFKKGAGVLDFRTRAAYTGDVEVLEGTLRLNYLQPMGYPQPLGLGTSPIVLGATEAHAALELDVDPTFAFLDRPISIQGEDAEIIFGDAAVGLGGLISMNDNQLTLTTAQSNSIAFIESDFTGYGGLVKIQGPGVIQFFSQAIEPLVSVQDGTLLVVGENYEVIANGIFIDDDAELHVDDNGSIQASSGVTINGYAHGEGRIGGQVEGDGLIAVEDGKSMTLGNSVANNGFLFSGDIHVGGIRAANQGGGTPIFSAARADLFVEGEFASWMYGTIILGHDSTLNSEQAIVILEDGLLRTEGVLGFPAFPGDFGSATINAPLEVRSVVQGPVPGIGRTLTLNGDIFNSGTMVGDLTFNAEYQLSSNPANGLISGAATFTSTSTVPLELGGVTPRVDHQQVIIEQSATLGGALELSYDNGFIAQPGQEIVVLIAPTIVGEFDTVIFPDEQNWSIEYDYLAGEVTVGISPCSLDLDGDGQIGASDLAALIGNWGATDVPADFDGGGVGASDLATLLGSWGPCP